MASADNAHDPEWRLESVSWDADTMEASTKDTSSGGRAGGSVAANRAPNTSCQVEGCTAFLPLRSYYQRQHICEEHFRAVVITEPSGRSTRFCQQCTKLEPLDNFDGDRRSCRESLVRRNMRRQGRRTGSTRRARPAKKPRAAPAAPAGASGSGDSTTGVPRTSSPSGATTASPPEPPSSVQQSKRPRSEPAPSPPAVSAAYWLQPAAGLDSGSGSAAGSGCSPAALPPHLLGAIEQLEALEPALTGHPLPAGLGLHPSQLLQQARISAAQHSATLPGGSLGQRLPPLHGGPPAVGAPQLSVTGMGPAELGSLAGLNVDQLLAIDSDLLADLLLAGSRAYTAAPAAAPAAAAPAAAGTSAAAAHAGWALPQPAPQQQALYQLPASAAPQPHAVQLARVVAAPPASAAHRHGHAAHAVHHAVPQQLHGHAVHHAVPQQLHGHAVPYVAVQQVPAQPAPHAPAPAAGQPTAPDVAAFAASFFGDWPASSPKEAEMDALLGGFEPSYDEMRLSLKLYGVHPDQLPAALRAELLSAVAVPPTAAQAAIRAGCVHLTLTTLIDAEERRRLLAPGAAATVLARLLPLVQRLPAQHAALQLGQGGGSSAAMLAAPRSGGGPAALLSLQLGEGNASCVPPALAVQSPLATTVSACRGFFRLRCPRGLLWGAGGLMAVCRRAGTGHVPLSLALDGTAAEQLPPPGAGAEECEEAEEAWPASEDDDSDDEAAERDPNELVDLEAWVPFAGERGGAASSDTPLWQAGWGLYEFEVARGALVGPATPVLVLPDAHAAAAAELAQLPPGLKAATVLRLAALVLRYLAQREAATGPQAAAKFQERYPPLAVARLAAAARQLLGLARRAGWQALAALLEPAAIADGWHPARAALMAAPQLVVAAPGPAPAQLPAAAAAQPATQQLAAATPLAAAAEPAAAEPVADAEQEAVHVVGSLLPAPAPAAVPSAPALASGSSDSPRKPGAAGSAALPSGKAAAGISKELEAQLPELSEHDSLRRVMHPAVLCAASAVVAGCVLGVGWALGAGHL